MLEGLDQVPWATLTHAYGSAADVPGLLRALTSDDPDARHHARYELYGTIFHQGSRYEASAYAVPFLYELLADPSTPERSELVDLLVSLAIGYESTWLPGRFPIDELREWVRANPPDPAAAEHHRAWSLQPEDDRNYGESPFDDAYPSLENNWELATYDAVAARLPALREAATAADPDLAAAGMRALAWFPAGAEESGRLLASIIAADPDSPALGTALLALGLLTSDGDSDWRHRIESHLSDNRAEVRWSAAIALARIDGPASSEETARELIACTIDDGEVEVPFFENDLNQYAAGSLALLGDAQIDRAIEALATQLGRSVMFDGLASAGTILELAFPDGGPAAPDFAELTPRQQRAVRALAEAERAWGADRNSINANLAGYLRGYGLPGTYQELRQYAGLS